MNRPLTPATTPVLGDDLAIRDQLGRLRQQQDRLFAQLDHGQQHFKQLARSVWRVQEDERRRLARELHDGLGQNLTALKHQLDALAQQVGPDSELRSRLDAALALTSNTLEEARTLSRMLRPQILDDLGLEAALRWLGRSLGESAAFVVQVECSGCEAVDGDLATLLFRVAQEALTNIAKHARAGHVLLRIGVRDQQLQLLVADDGVGCEPSSALARNSSGASTGLGSIRERVALFGGRLTFISEPGEGTQLRVQLRLDPTNESRKP